LHVYLVARAAKFEWVISYRSCAKSERVVVGVKVEWRLCPLSGMLGCGLMRQLGRPIFACVQEGGGEAMLRHCPPPERER
jgi:hypothetical protein